MNRSLRENILFLMVAHACFLAEPIIVHAEGAGYDLQNFRQPLSVARGKVTSGSANAAYLDHDDSCRLVVAEFGWQMESCAEVDKIVFGLTPEVDTLIFNKPVSDGYVQLDDWKGSAGSEAVDEITKEYQHSIVGQSKATGSEIEFVGWKLYPTVDEARHLMYFASMVNWDGENILNVTVSIFDRGGYVPLKLVPVDSNLSGDALQSLVHDVADHYEASTGNGYAEFSSGDKVAAYGAVGVFAGLLGVKYGKAATAGLLAVGLLVLKKAWFLVLLPFVAIGKLFGRRKKAEPSA